MEGMKMSTQPIQTRLELLFTRDNKDVTEYLTPDLLSFEYDDKETDEADEISISLMDPIGKWAGRWKPDGGEIIRASIISGTTTEKLYRLNCGKFYVDSIRASGSPRVTELRAVSIPLNKAIRRKLKTRAWEKQTLKSIASKIADESEVELFFDSEFDPAYDRQDQKRESDLKFLSRLCEDQGLSLKVTDDRIVIFDQESYEKKIPITIIELGKSDVLSWDFESAQSETYKTCTVTYRDPKRKSKSGAGTGSAKNPAVNTFTYTDPDADENGQEYTLKKRATSISEARQLAKAKLRQLNMRRVTGSMTVVGNVSLVAGVVIACVGFGAFDGTFIVENARHSVTSSGYTTALTLRKTNNNY